MMKMPSWKRRKIIYNIYIFVVSICFSLPFLRCLRSRKGTRQRTKRIFLSSRRRHTRCGRDWSSDLCSSDLPDYAVLIKNFGKEIGIDITLNVESQDRSEERRVGKEGRSRWSPYH